MIETLRSARATAVWAAGDPLHTLLVPAHNPLSQWHFSKLLEQSLSTLPWLPAKVSQFTCILHFLLTLKTVGARTLEIGASQYHVPSSANLVLIFMVFRNHLGLRWQAPPFFLCSVLLLNIMIFRRKTSSQSQFMDWTSSCCSFSARFARCNPWYLERKCRSSIVYASSSWTHIHIHVRTSCTLLAFVSTLHDLF